MSDVVHETPAEGTIGVDLPDRRGRTGLDRAGRDLSRNPRVVVRDVEVLSSNWCVHMSPGSVTERLHCFAAHEPRSR